MKRAHVGGLAVGLVLLAAACSAQQDGPPSASTSGSGTSTTGSGDTTATGTGGDIGFGGASAATGTTAATGAGGGCAAVSQTATSTQAPVDIIWALDTSDSMVFELQAVEDNMNQFASTILNQGVDVHVVVVAKPGEPDGGNIFNPDPGICIDPPLATGSCPGGSKPPSYQHVEVSVGSNNALNKLIETYPTYKPTLRANAVKYFAVVTDDEATDGPYNSAASFSAAVSALDPGYFDAWKFFGVFCTGSCGVFLACEATGDVYLDLVAQTGGLAGDLCGGNSDGFAPVFNALAQTVVQSTPLDCAWAIPPPPEGETFDPEKVNVEFTSAGGSTGTIYHVDSAADCGPQGGWYYDDPAAPTKVLVCPSTCSAIQADPGGTIDVLFGCATIDVPT
jgi:hypothetical protein